MEKLTVMGIGAHPDDLELFCGGTLAKYANLGWRVFMCHATNGDKGHFNIPPDQLGEVRRKEALNAARAIDAEAIFLNLPDGEIEVDVKTRALFIDAIRQCRPHVIITHPTEDYHGDHEAVSRLVIAASFFAGVTHIKTTHETFEHIPHIYFMDTYAGVNFNPEEYVDIGNYINKKTEMLKAHESQLQWLKEHDQIDVLTLMDVSARYRGFQCMTVYAEGFKAYRSSLRIGTTRLLP